MFLLPVILPLLYFVKKTKKERKAKYLTRSRLKLFIYCIQRISIAIKYHTLELHKLQTHDRSDISRLSLVNAIENRQEC